jgi:hypothetical protein
VTFVQKKIGALPIHIPGLFRSPEYFPDFLDAGCDRIELNKARLRGSSNNGSQRGLSAAGRPKKDGTGQAVGFNGTSEQPAFAKNLFLTDKFVQVSWPHAVCKRR